MKPSPWTAAFRAASVAQQDTIPKGFQSVREIAKQIHRSDSHTRKIIRDLVAVQGAEVRYFRIQGKHMLREMPFYRLKVPVIRP